MWTQKEAVHGRGNSRTVPGNPCCRLWETLRFSGEARVKSSMRQMEVINAFSPQARAANPRFIRRCLMYRQKRDTVSTAHHIFR